MPRAGRVARFAAALLDAVAIAVVALLLSSGPGVYFGRRTVALLRLIDNGEFWRGVVPMVMSAAGGFVFGIPFASILTGVVESGVGASPGQMVAGIQALTPAGTAPPLFTRTTRVVVKRIGAIVVAVAVAGQVGWLAAVGLVLAVGSLCARLVSFASGSDGYADRIVATAVYRLPR